MSDNFLAAPQSEGADAEGKPRVNAGLINMFKSSFHSSINTNDDELPEAYELQDLFQIHFNQLGSCIDTTKWKEDVYKNSGQSIWQKETQSMQLFFKKFGGTIGLLNKLRSCRNGDSNSQK